MEPNRGQYIIYIGKHPTKNLSCKCSSIQLIRKRRRTVQDDESSCSHVSHSFNMLFSYPLLVGFTTFLIFFWVPYPAHALPFDESFISGNSDSLSNSHRSHNMDLLIDPIHQAEYGDEELEIKKVVAKSVFDMVLRTPPPSTTSYTRCPPGSQSPFEGGPCIKKSTDPVAFVDHSFLLDTLRGLTKDGVLLSGMSNRTRRPGGNNRKRPTGRPKLPSTSTPRTTLKITTQQPISTITTEITRETTFMHSASNPHPHSSTSFTDDIVTDTPLVSPDTVTLLDLLLPSEGSFLPETTEMVSPIRHVEEVEDAKKTLSAKSVSSLQNNVTTVTSTTENDAALNRDGKRGVESFVTRNIINNTNAKLKQFINDQLGGEADKSSVTYSSLPRSKEVVERPLQDQDQSLANDNVLTFDQKPSIVDENKFENKANVPITNEGLKQAVSAYEKHMKTTQYVSMIEKGLSEIVGDVDHPSVTVVNHMSQYRVAEEETQKKGIEAVALDFGLTDTTSIVGDLVTINNYTISRAYHAGENNRKDQVISSSNKDEEMLFRLLKNHSSKDQEKTDDQMFTTELLPKLQTTSIFPSTTEFSSLHPKNTLLQFQLPIVAERKIMFPHDASIESVTDSPLQIPTRPLYIQNFQLDYPPKEFLRSNHPGIASNLQVNTSIVEAFKAQKQQEKKTLKSIPSTISSSTGDMSLSSTVSDYHTGSTEYLESELDRRHQRTRSRNRMKSFEPTTYQPMLTINRLYSNVLPNFY